MIRTLVVEDDQEKRAAVLEALALVEGFDRGWVSVAHTAVEAKRQLRATRFDLVVLDIALPLQDGGEVVRDAGVRVVEEIVSRPDQFKTPSHIIGLTAYDNVYELAAGRFASWLISLLHYDPTDGEWARRLRAKARQLVLSDHAVEVRSEVSAVIVCALQRPELDAVLRLSCSWDAVFLKGDQYPYWKGVFGASSSTVIAVACPRMGIAAASAMVERVVWAFQPKHVIMAGIMAGVNGRVSMGDAIAADPCWDWGSGKWIEDGGTSRFLPAPHQVGMDVQTREQVRLLSRDEGFLSEVWSSSTHKKPPAPPKLHIGPTASGASVVADRQRVAEIVAQHRQVLGIEMEAYGAYAAAEESREPRPRRLVLKTVVDFADKKKSDDFQAHGAHVSAQIVGEFLRRFGNT